MSKSQIDLTGDSEEDEGDLALDEDMLPVSASQASVDDVRMGLAAGLTCEQLSLAELRVAEEAVLALVDFPKQIVVALAVAIKYMKSGSMRWSLADSQLSSWRTLSAIALHSQR